MNTRTAIATSLAVFGLGMGATQGCSSGEIQIARDNSGLYGGEIDAGTGLCGTQTCAAGELCCAGTDESCSPTCMKVSSCPIYGHPCKVDAGASDGGGQTDAGKVTLQWYTTCGYPACEADAGRPPAPGCDSAGTLCTTKGQTCGDPSQTCGSVMVCDDHDPKAGGCPISTAKYKEGIHYLDEAELAALHDETLGTRLASYAYTGPWANGSDAQHLGFIIEDRPQSFAVDRGHDRVDLYGYVSMVVATMQVQDKQIRALQKELADTRASCARR
jgi:hypothetical protein